MKCPPCFTDEQWKGWLEAAGATKVNVEGHGVFCLDCLPAYKLKMVIVGRCLHPGTKFRFDSDGFIYGSCPREKRNEG